MTKFVDNFESSLIGQDRTSEKYRLKTAKFVTQSQVCDLFPNKQGMVWFGLVPFIFEGKKDILVTLAQEPGVVKPGLVAGIRSLKLFYSTLWYFCSECWFLITEETPVSWDYHFHTQNILLRYIWWSSGKNHTTSPLLRRALTNFLMILMFSLDNQAVFKRIFGV